MTKIDGGYASPRQKLFIGSLNIMLPLTKFIGRRKAIKIGNRYQTNSGFTLIELLMVTIIVGILSSLAILTVLGQVQKAQEVEAINFVGTMNRFQSAKFQENNYFAKSLTELELPVPEAAKAIVSPLDVFNIESRQTENFIYGTYSFAFNGKPLAINFAIAKKGNMKSVVGAVLVEDEAMKYCEPVKVNANINSSLTEVFLLLIDMRKNPSKHCPNLF